MVEFYLFLVIKNVLQLISKETKNMQIQVNETIILNKKERP